MPPHCDFVIVTIDLSGYRSIIYFLPQLEVVIIEKVNDGDLHFLRRESVGVSYFMHLFIEL